MKSVLTNRVNPALEMEERCLQSLLDLQAWNTFRFCTRKSRGQDLRSKAGRMSKVRSEGSSSAPAPSERQFVHRTGIRLDPWLPEC